MGTLVIENVDEALMGDLAHVAAINRVSVETEVKRVLRDATPQRDSGTLLKLLQSIADMTPVGVTQSDSTALIRDDRDR
jgi:antitoxin FitA